VDMTTESKRSPIKAYKQTSDCSRLCEQISLLEDIDSCPNEVYRLKVMPVVHRG
jgi:hypothetical protein